MELKKYSLKKKFQIIFLLFCGFGFIYASIIAIYKSYLITAYISDCNLVINSKNKEILNLVHILVINELNKTSLLLESYITTIKFYSKDQNLLRAVEKNEECDNLIQKYFVEVDQNNTKKYFNPCLKINFENCNALNDTIYEESNFENKDEKMEIMNNFILEKETRLYPNFVRIFNETLFEVTNENIIDQYFDKEEFMLKSEGFFNISKSYIESINLENFDFGTFYYVKFVKNLYESKLNTKPPFQIVFSFPAQKNFHKDFINFEEIFEKRHNIYFNNNNIFLFILLNENEKIILVMNFSNTINKFFDSNRFSLELNRDEESLSSEFQFQKQNKTKINKILSQSYTGANNDIFNTISLITFNVI